MPNLDPVLPDGVVDGSITFSAMSPPAILGQQQTENIWNATSVDSL